MFVWGWNNFILQIKKKIGKWEPLGEVEAYVNERHMQEILGARPIGKNSF